MANDNDKFLSITQDYGSLYSDVCSIIDTTRHQLATAYTNYQLLMYWHIGARINQNVLGGKRGEYGAQIVSTCRHNYKSNMVGSMQSVTSAE